jgi:6-pyruvoyltetrahydropterin/6-carboxytetrahydropterin synthase
MGGISHGPPHIFGLDLVTRGDDGKSMYRISKQFSFSASHQLTHLPVNHMCARLHGHNYKVEVVVESPMLDDRGFCGLDYGELAPFKNMLDAVYDHRHLNDVMDVRPTAENLARVLFDHARKISPFVVEVRVSETESTWASYHA